MNELEEILRRGANGTWRLGLSDPMLAQFRRYAEILIEWNATRLNLTRITEPREIAVKHYLDSLAILTVVSLKPGARVIDIGTGAGLPGIALQIARPDLNMTLLDSTAKKIAFCRFAADALGLADIQTLHARAEEAGRRPELFQTSDLVLARAVAPLERLLGWCAPFVRADGVIAAYKGASVADEWAAARPVARRLGLTLEPFLSIPLPAAEEPITRYIVLARRIRQSERSA